MHGIRTRSWGASQQGFCSDPREHCDAGAPAVEGLRSFIPMKKRHLDLRYLQFPVVILVEGRENVMNCRLRCIAERCFILFVIVVFIAVVDGVVKTWPSES